MIHEISKLDYILDTDFNKIGEAIINSDLIFADYGGIVFDTLYLEKIILLDLDSKTNFVKTLKDVESVDIDIRNHLKSLKDEDTEKNIMTKLRIVIDENLERVKTLKNHYFGKKNYLNFEQNPRILTGFIMIPLIHIYRCLKRFLKFPIQFSKIFLMILKKIIFLIMLNHK